MSNTVEASGKSEVVAEDSARAGVTQGAGGLGVWLVPDVPLNPASARQARGRGSRENAGATDEA